MPENEIPAEKENILSYIVEWWEGKNPLLSLILGLILPIGGWALWFLVQPVQAQVKDYSTVASEFPIEKEKIRQIREDIKELKMEQKAQRDILIETSSNVKLLLRKHNGR